MTFFMLLNLILQCGQWHTRYDHPTSHRGIMGDRRWSAKHTAQCIARNSIQTRFGTNLLESPLNSTLRTNISEKYMTLFVIPGRSFCAAEAVAECLDRCCVFH